MKKSLNGKAKKMWVNRRITDSIRYVFFPIPLEILRELADGPMPLGDIHAVLVKSGRYGNATNVPGAAIKMKLMGLIDKSNQLDPYEITDLGRKVLAFAIEVNCLSKE